MVSFLELMKGTRRVLFSEDVLGYLGQGVWPPAEFPPGAGIVWMGEWESDVLYLDGDGVSYNGASYIAVEQNLGSIPPSSFWDVVAEKGDTGLPGAPGETGAEGPQGVPGNDGAPGVAGPNTVTATTTSTLTGLLKGTGTLVAVATAPTDYVATGDSRLGDARAPTAHATTHKSGGVDVVKLDELAAPTDVTTLDATTSLHGLMMKYPGGTTNFLRADGAFAAPTAAAAWGSITGTLSAQTDLQNALDLKAPLANPTFTGTVAGVTKAMVGLTNADDTTDANKPVSSAQQTALNLKANLAGPTFTGTVVLPAGTVTLAMQANMATASVVYRTTAGSGAPEVTSLATLKTNLVLVKADVGLGSVDNTTDAGKPVSTAQQTALDLKANLAGPTFTGVPAAPTAAVGTNTTQVATTAFVLATKLDTLAATTDITTLNATSTAHGLLPKLSNVSTEFLNGTGAFSVPAGGGGGGLSMGLSIAVSRGYLMN